LRSLDLDQVHPLLALRAVLVSAGEVLRVTFHGVRGSIPTPGPTTVRYGGNTVCVEVRTLDGTLIILDAGTGIRGLGDQLLAAGPTLPAPMHLFVTHVHWDHIIGAPFFAPMYRKDAHIVLHALSDRMFQLAARLIMFDGEHFPVRQRDLPAHIERPPPTVTARAGSAVVSRIALNHPGGADGYRIDDADGSSLCYLTDNELNPPGDVVTTPEELARFAHDTGLLIHDAQYLPSDMPHKRGWGHSLVDETLALARSAGARALALHHHDPGRADDALDDVAAHAHAWARANAPAMRCLVAAEGLTLDVLPP
jgi:phosphoribosyl 1,2-cyclic phosphodiesterase